MKLARYMTREGLDDETMAARLRDSGDPVGAKCDRTQVGRWRKGKRRPDWPMIALIARVTGNAVTADDWMVTEPAA